jgi:formamidopyrimidine-DNA glycosylase
MPELPEVETVVRTLRPLVCGRTIVSIRTSDKKLRRPWDPAWASRLRHRRIVAVRRRGKWIILELDTEGCLLVHLGMTGRLRVVPAGVPAESHTHAFFRLAPGRQELRFRDVRRFGSLEWVERAELAAFFDKGRLGPEPFALKKAEFRETVNKTRRCLKAALLDQRLAAGVGNIYADESLFQARLHPGRLGRDLSTQEAERLRRAIVQVLGRAIEKKGSTIRDYVDGNGQSGDYQREFRVYGRAGEPCPRCRTPIERIRLAGRSTHFCPRCQLSVVRSP